MKKSLKEENEDRDTLFQDQKQLQSDPQNLELQAYERKKFQKLRTSSYMAEVYLQQRS